MHSSILADAAASATNLVFNPDSFYKFRESDLREMWTLKLLDASAYILFIVRIHGAAGWKWSFKIKEFCEIWNIGRRTFFRAVSELRTLNLLHWESGDRITVWYGSDIASDQPTEEVPTASVTTLSSMSKDVSNNKVTTLSPIVTTVALTETTLSSTVTTITPKINKTLAETDVRNTPDSSQIKFKSSSDLFGEEDLKLKEKKEESLRLSTVELDQKTSDRVLNESSQQEHTLESTELNQLITKSDRTSTQEEALLTDEEFLSWVMQVKIPSMNLQKQVINAEAYASKMIRRDGDKLRAEYDIVTAEAESVKQIAKLTAQVEARVAEWQKVSDAQLTVYHNLDGEPMVLLDGAEIGGTDFLIKPIQVAPMVQTIPFNEEIRAQRTTRMSRLRLAVKLAEFPGLEFLRECWEDILLRAQVKIAIAKYPGWAVVKDGKLATT